MALLPFKYNINSVLEVAHPVGRDEEIITFCGDKVSGWPPNWNLPASDS